MSKSKNNFPDPWQVIDKYGVDALRYYLLALPVMQGENLNFSEKEVDEIYKKVILLLGNVHSFLRMFSTEKFVEGTKPPTDNILDAWIFARLHELQVEVTVAMDSYNTVRATRPILLFINDLSTWYVRRSRDRVKAGDSDAKNAMQTLAYVLTELAKLMAPFMPFISERIYKDLTGNESVHLADWNEQGNVAVSAAEKTLLANMQSAREIVELALSARKEANIKVRQPLEYLAYKFKSAETQPLDQQIQNIIAQELNVKEVHFAPEIAQMPETVLRENNEMQILLSIEMSPELKAEGFARELERQVQDMRKKFGLRIGDLIDLYYNTADSVLEQALIEKFDRKKTFVVQIKKELEVEPDIEAQVKIEEKAIWLGIIKM